MGLQSFKESMSRLSGSIAIALLTGCTYLAAHSYESSFLSHFGIPNELVQISIETLIRSLSAVAIFVFFTVLLLNLIVPFFSDAIDEPHSEGRRWAFVHFIYLCVGIVLARAFGFSWNGLLIFTVVILVFDVLLYGLAVVLPKVQEKVFQWYEKEDPADAERIRAQNGESKDSTLSIEDILRKWFGPELWMLVIAYFFVSTLGMLAANYNSRQQTIFSALEDEKIILIRKYGDYFMGKRYLINPPRLEPGMVILRIEDLVGKDIKYVNFENPPEVVGMKNGELPVLPSAQESVSSAVPGDSGNSSAENVKAHADDFGGEESKEAPRPPELPK